MPPMQSAQPVPPVQPIQPAGPQYPSAGVPGMPMVQQVQLPPPPKKNHGGLIKTIVIIFLTLALITFIGLFIWMMMQYDEARTDVDGQIDVAVAKALDENTQKMEEEFDEREKDPYRDFVGPVDYGQLYFKYPKTWSLYIARDAAKGGDYEAYFNPIEVEAINGGTIYALRLMIYDRSFDDIVAGYQGAVQDPNSGLSMFTTEINGTTANRYEGKIPGTEFNGIFVIIKIRDKTALLRTDSVLFKDDFDRLVSTIKFNV